MTSEFVLAAVEARLLASGAFEALWHLERMDAGERALLVAREVCGNPQDTAEKVAA